MNRKIDLTEHLDFQEKIEFFEVSFNPENIDEETMMTKAEYDVFHRFEEIFGKRHHTSQALQIFHGSKKDFDIVADITPTTTCFRCGKYKAPWRFIFGLCPKCLSETQRLKIIPWNQQYAIDNPNRIKDELFNSK